MRLPVGLPLVFQAGLLLLFGLFLFISCAFLGIPTSRQYSAEEARSRLDAALQEAILLASLTGSSDEQDGARIVQNLILQLEALHAGVFIESGQVYEKADVDRCADDIRSRGAIFGVALTPEAVGLSALNCDVPAQ